MNSILWCLGRSEKMFCETLCAEVAASVAKPANKLNWKMFMIGIGVVSASRR